MDPKLDNFSSGQTSAPKKPLSTAPDCLSYIEQLRKVRMRPNTSKPLIKMAESSYFILFYFRQEDSWQSNPCNNSYKVRKLLLSESCKMLHLLGLRQTNFFLVDKQQHHPPNTCKFYSFMHKFHNYFFRL